MKRGLFILLAIGALLAVVLAWQLGLKPQSADPLGADVLAAGDPLLSDFTEIANGIDRLDVIGAGNTTLVTLQRGDGIWGIAQRDGYPADWPAVRSLLRELGQAKVIAPKTAREEYYPRLGVADVSRDDTGGGLLRWGEGDGQALIIGIEAEDLTGRYVRQPGSAQSYLVDQQLDVKTDPADWINKAIIDWQGSRLQEVTIRHPDGDVVRIRRDNEDALEMRLVNIPEGREVSGQWAVNGIANSLISLRADDVRRAGELPDDAIRALFVTDDGINLVISLYQEQPEQDDAVVEADAEVADDSSAETRYIARLDVSLEPTPATDTDSQVLEQMDASDDATAPGASEDAGETGPAAEVEQLQTKTEGWEFIIPDYKYNSLNKRLEDLLRPLPEADDGAAG